MKLRRKPDFDRFIAGLSKRVDGWLNDPDYTPQDLVNTVRSELARIWKYLIEKINKQEKELRSLQAENKKLREALDFYAKTESWNAVDCDPLYKSVSIIEGVIDHSDIEDTSNGTEIRYGGRRAREALKEGTKV
jgi:hypothetical protein